MPGERTAAEIETEILGAEVEPALEADPLLEVEDGDLPVADPVIVAAEAEAGRKGWVPKALYKGDPKKWVDASTFLQRGERFVKNLQSEVETLKQQLANFQGTAAKFAKFHEETVKAKNDEIKEAISALRIQRAQAIVDGDAEASVAFEDRIDLLKEQQKEVKEVAVEAEAPKTNVNDPVLQEWVEEENQWFQTEPKMRDYAIALGEDMVKRGEKALGRAFLDKVAERMRADFPRYFRTKNTPKPATDSDTGGAGGSSGATGKTERDLPADDRTLMRELIAMGSTTKERFLASYFSGEPKRYVSKK